MEIEGIDLDEDEAANGEDDTDEKLSIGDVPDDDDDELVSKRAHEDHDELEAAKRERMELMAVEAKKIADEAPQGKASVEEQLMYLLGQSEVFAHFLAGT